MSYNVPYSSSPEGPPSTPDRRSSNGSIFGYSNNPSTTPAGPPPSSAQSFTPVGNPPSSSYFGSSMIDNQSPLQPLSFSQASSYSGKDSPAGGYGRSSAAPRRSGLRNQYQGSPQSVQEEEEEEYEDEEEEMPRNELEYSEEDQDEDASYEEDAPYDDEADDDEDMDDDVNPRTICSQSSSVDMDRIVAGVKPSREGEFMQSVYRPGGGKYQAIAKGLYTRMGQPPVNETDDIILNTERIVTRLYEEGIGADQDNDRLQEALSIIPGELTELWEDQDHRTSQHNSEEYAATIGPGPRGTSFAKANFLSGLTLQIRHPKVISTPFGAKQAPLPQVLLSWMDKHHNHYPSELEDVQSHRPSPASHQLFWDTIFNSLLRGKVIEVVTTLKNAGWSTARTENHDSSKFRQMGYSGVALNNVERVVDSATKVLSQCPAVRGDWNTRNGDWTLFRLRVSQALEELREFAEGRSRELKQSFAATGRSSTYSTAAKKAESAVPWQIYESLVTLYSLAMGDSNAITANAQDWCEATIGLLVWWDEGKDDRRLALGRSQNNYRAAMRDSDEEAYIRKLRRSFETATARSTDFEVNSADDVEVGLASLFEGDYESVIGFLRGWSGPISSAVAEVGSLAGWLPPPEEKDLMNMGGSLDQDDLDLLGLNSSPSKCDGVKDQTLVAYAHSLTQRGELKSSAASSRPHIAREAWEVAISVLGRLDSSVRSEEMVGDFLNGLPFHSSETVDKLWKLLNDLGMGRYAESTADTYADSLAEKSHKYGEALWYYSLAKKDQKVKDVLNLLISYSLIQSTPYPAEDELDAHLKSLISSPKNALTELSNMDVEAAQLLHKMLSGYATLRKFYNLRDETLTPSTGTKPRTGTRAQKIEAASCLLAVITSSDDNIRGGLYDAEREAVVSVDFLLALLGEAMVFVNQPDFVITVPQIDILLTAIEDLQAVGPRIYTACTEFLRTVVASGQGLRGSTPSDMLRKSTSNLSGSSFSMVGSSMLASQLKQSMSSSGVLVKGTIKRGWDWRRGITAGTDGEDILKIMRIGLAKDLAKAWLREADGM